MNSLQDGRAREQFRSGIELVQVDAIVTDADGRPVRGLTRADFVLREDDVVMEIVDFQAIELPDAPAAPIVSLPEVSSGSVIQHNLRASEGGIYVILLDFSLSPGVFERVRKTVRTIIQHLGPTDLAAMVSTGGQRAYQVEFTNDRSRLSQALDRLAVDGQNMEELPSAVERISKQLEAIPARRKVIALVSEGFYFDPEKPEYRLALDAAQKANVAVYPFDPKFAGSIDKMISGESAAHWSDYSEKDRQSVAALQTLAANTGGFATVRTNLLSNGVKRMLAENRCYYLLRYYSRAPRDGRFHRTVVQTRTPALEVRARAGHTASKENVSRAAAASSLTRLIAAPIQTHGLDIRAVAVPVPAHDRGGALAILSEVRAADLAGSAGLELSAVLVDMSGKIRAREEYGASLQTGLEPDGRWIRVASRLAVPRAGTYQLRIAARRSDGLAGGSVFARVEVPSFSHDLAPGGLALGIEGLDGVARAEKLAGLRGIGPVAITELPSGMPFSAALPLRVSSKHAAAIVEVRAQLIASDGSTRELLETTRAASDFTTAAGDAVVLPLPLKSLLPGQYRLRVQVALGDRLSQQREIGFAIQSGSAR